MSDAYWVVMRIETADLLGEPRPGDPIGFMPVFASEAAARQHAGEQYAVHAVRSVPPAPRPARQEPNLAASGAKDER